MSEKLVKIQGVLAEVFGDVPFVGVTWAIVDAAQSMTIVNVRKELRSQPQPKCGATLVVRGKPDGSYGSKQLPCVLAHTFEILEEHGPTPKWPAWRTRKST